MESTILAADAIYSNLADDPCLSELIEMLIDEMPDRIETLESLYANEDWTGLGTLAHQLKGALGSYGFDGLTTFAASLENSIKEGSPKADIKQALDVLIQLCGKMRAGVAPT